MIKIKKRIYAEMGFGNETFLSTEIEEGRKERRVPRFILPKKIRDIYLRIWILRASIIISTADGIKIKKKDDNKFKLVFGIGGENK